MLALNDPRWGRLQHAYGPASDVPALLKQLQSSTGPNQGPWEGLWSNLCHQGDVYTASYAAVPHIVSTAIGTTTRVDFSFFALPAAIEIARARGRGQPIPGDIADGYHAAVARLADAVFGHHDEPWDREHVRSAATALAVAKGHIDLAEAIFDLDEDWIKKINNERRG
jgi:hypothetical protein